MRDMISLNDNRVTGEFAIVALRVAAVQGASFLLIPVLTKTLGTEAFGTWAQYKSALRMLTPLVSLNLSYGLLRNIPSIADEERLGQLLSTSMIVLIGSCAAAGGVYLGRAWIADTFLDGQVAVVSLFTLMLPAFAVTNLLLDFLRAERRIVTHSIASTALYLSVPVGFLGLAVGGGSLATCLQYYLAVQIAALGVLAWLVLRSHSPARPHFGHLKELIPFSLPLMAVAFQFSIVEFADRFLVSYYLGLKATGSYATGYQIGSGLQLLLAPFAFLLPPIVSKKWDRGKRPEVARILSDSAAVFVGLSLPVVVVFASHGRLLLALISKASIAGEAHGVLVVTASSYLFYGIFVIAGQSLFAQKRSVAYAVLWFASMLTNVLLNVLLIPRLGIDGAALGTLGSHVLLVMTFFALFRPNARDILNRELWWLMLVAPALVLPVLFLSSLVGTGPALRLGLAATAILLWLGIFRLACPGTLRRLQYMLTRVS